MYGDDGLLFLLPNTYDFFLCAHGHASSDLGHCLRFYSWLLPLEAPLLFERAAIKTFFPRNIPSYSKKERG